MDRLLKARRLSREESAQLREMLDRYEEEEDHR
jgi:hypothetical protein